MYKSLLLNKNVHIIASLLIGVLLLAFPEESLNIAGYIITSIVFLVGLFFVLRLFVHKTYQSKLDIFYAVLGVILIIISISIFLNPTWIITAINVVVGFLLVVNGLTNLINILYLKDKDGVWWTFAAISLLILILGIVVIIKPLEVAKFIISLEGLSLISDTIITFLITRRMKRFLIEFKPEEVNK